MTKPPPRPPMVVLNLGGTYLLLPESEGVELFKNLRNVIHIESTWNDATPYKYAKPGSNTKATLTHISEEMLAIMDAKASLEE